MKWKWRQEIELEHKGRYCGNQMCCWGPRRKIAPQVPARKKRKEGR